MYGEHNRTRDHGTLSVLHGAANGARRHALRVRAANRPQQDATNKKSKRSENGGATHVFSVACRHARPPYPAEWEISKDLAILLRGCHGGETKKAVRMP
jgi:hypothetical protein